MVSSSVEHDQIASSSFELYSEKEVFALLRTRPEGLMDDEAKERLEQFGPNAIMEVKRKSLWVKLMGNFLHLMAILLWVAGIVAFLSKMPQLSVSIWMVNIINGIFSFWQEFKAERATEAMRRLLPMYSNVLREGAVQRVGAEGLVPGDVVLLSEGDRISADGRLIECSGLRVDQSTLTGEALHVKKTADALGNHSLSRIEIPNIVFAGTSVVSGDGKAVIFATGMQTEFGKIARFTQALGDEASPLQIEMQRATKLVTLIAVSIGCLFFLLAVLAAGVDLAESFIFGMGMVVAFVPEGLLPTVTLSLAMGVQRMARRNALIKRLSAVETLGCTSVICTDKTGTLTQNEMTVREIWTGGSHLTVTGTGYAPTGGVFAAGIPVQALEARDLARLLVAAALCNNARLIPPDSESPRWSIIGDPTEGALRVLAEKSGLDVKATEREIPRLRELPFESRRKRMSTIHRAADGTSTIVFLKGAPREVLNLCTRILMKGNEEELQEALRLRIMEANDLYARNGLRVLAVAERTLGSAPSRAHIGSSEYSPDAIECDLTFLGLVAMMDPPRMEVSEAVEKCHEAGIRIIMITGDYGLTAESIARRIGIVRGEHLSIVSGSELESMDEEILRDLLQAEVIFSRAAPEHKLRVVTALQEMGHVVAVTGDGVNDAPALKKADIGVAMGISGTDVAKEASDMILTDDNFASIVHAIEEGRAVYANIKKFTTYIFTSNTPEAVPFILFALSRTRIPLALNVMHVLAVDLGTDLVPALGLGAEAPEQGIMARPPRSRDEHVITRSLLLRAYLFLGPLQSLAVMAAFYFQYWTHGYWGQWVDLPSSGALYRSATAMALACVVTTQIGNLFAQRTELGSVFRTRMFSNRLLWLGILSEFIIILLIVYFPPLQDIIGTESFAPVNWLFLLAWSPLLLLADECRKFLLRRWAQKQYYGG